MSRNEILQLVGRLYALYPNIKKYTVEELDVWHDQLRDYPIQACIESLNYHVKYEKYPPTLADFVKYGPETNEDLKKLFMNGARNERKYS